MDKYSTVNAFLVLLLYLNCLSEKNLHSKIEENSTNEDITEFVNLSQKDDDLFNFDFDDLTESSDSILDDAVLLNRRAISFPQIFNYNYEDRDLDLTDVTSITSPTSNGFQCNLPFDFPDSLDNYFCVEDDNHANYECITENDDIGICDLGRWCMFKPFIRGEETQNLFDAIVEFKNKFLLNEDEFYELDFYYMIVKPDECSDEQLNLKLSLVNDANFFKSVFNSRDSNAKPPVANSWNRVKTCFFVTQNRYKIDINAINQCDNQDVFIAIDNLVVRGTNNSTECVDLRQEDDDLFNFNFDFLTENAASILDYAGLEGRRALSFPLILNYQFGNRQIDLTDITSITSPTSNDYPCDLPFNISDSTNNYFCVKNDIDPIINYECVTGNEEIATCNLGRMGVVKPFTFAGDWNYNLLVNIEFLKKISTTAGRTYEIEFHYLIDEGISCVPDDPLISPSLKMYFVDDISFYKLLFDSNQVSLEHRNRNQWNKFQICFTTDDNRYKVRINAFNECPDEKVFISFDNIIVREINETLGCLDLSEGLLFRFNFDNLDDFASSIDEFATLYNPDALSFPQTFTYTTIDTNKNITITDATSITTETSLEPYTCELPFDFESTTDNYFCVKNENENDKFQCNTALGEFGNCILGRWGSFTPLAFKGKTSEFESAIKFNKILTFDSDQFYEIEFFYLVEKNSCQDDEQSVELWLVDENDSLVFTLFNSIQVPKENRTSGQWNRIIICFQLVANSYQFKIIAKNKCDNQNVFVSVDNIVIKETSNNNECLDFTVQTTEPESTEETTYLYITSVETSEKQTTDETKSTIEFEMTSETQETSSASITITDTRITDIYTGFYSTLSSEITTSHRSTEDSTVMTTDSSTNFDTSEYSSSDSTNFEYSTSSEMTTNFITSTESTDSSTTDETVSGIFTSRDSTILENTSTEQYSTSSEMTTHFITSTTGSTEYSKTSPTTETLSSDSFISTQITDSTSKHTFSSSLTFDQTSTEMNKETSIEPTTTSYESSLTYTHQDSSTFTSTSTSTSTSISTSTSSTSSTTSNIDFIEEEIFVIDFENILPDQLLVDNASNFKIDTFIQIQNSNFIIPSFESSNKPTINNKECIFPFKFENETYNFCAKINETYQCLVDSENTSYDQCDYSANEKYLQSYSLEGDPFESKLTLFVNFEETGKYKVYFASLIYCVNEDECAKANDYISISYLLEDSRSSIEVIRVTLGNSESNKWSSESAEFVVEQTDSDILTLIVTIGRLYKNDEIAYIGFDDLRLTFISGIKKKPILNDFTLLIILLSTVLPLVLIGFIIFTIKIYNKRNRQMKKKRLPIPPIKQDEFFDMTTIKENININDSKNNFLQQNNNIDEKSSIPDFDPDEDFLNFN